ncbi:MAG: hypothetical protein GKS01_03065 [Alphaproteobacteria bacterium]|nr:hypothetical protein [Alphaproteobacteria bacterium]
MIRLILLFAVPLVAPTGFYILWRAFAPPKLGGSRAIAREDWEPLPWPWLIVVGGLLVIVSVFTIIAYPELLDF